MDLCSISNIHGLLLVKAACPCHKRTLFTVNTLSFSCSLVSKAPTSPPCAEWMQYIALSSRQECSPRYSVMDVWWLTEMWCTGLQHWTLFCVTGIHTRRIVDHTTNVKYKVTSSDEFKEKKNVSERPVIQHWSKKSNSHAIVNYNKIRVPTEQPKMAKTM